MKTVIGLDWRELNKLSVSNKPEHEVDSQSQTEPRYIEELQSNDDVEPPNLKEQDQRPSNHNDDELPNLKLNRILSKNIVTKRSKATLVDRSDRVQLSKKPKLTKRAVTKDDRVLKEIPVTDVEEYVANTESNVKKSGSGNSTKVLIFIATI